MKKMNMKYAVASRRIASKRLGTFGCLLTPGFLAVKKMIKKARTSMIPRSVKCEAHQNSRGEVTSGGEGAPKQIDRL